MPRAWASDRFTVSGLDLGHISLVVRHLAPGEFDYAAWGKEEVGETDH